MYTNAVKAKRKTEKAQTIEQEKLDITASNIEKYRSSYNSDKKCNEPKLTTGMKPVNYNQTTKKWEECEESEWDWNYDPQTTTTENGSGENVAKWANAMTEDGSLWVWIPRYAYKITSGYHTSTAGTIEIKFLVGNTNEDEEGNIIQRTYDMEMATANKYMSDYVVHPAFGNQTELGGWSTNIPGFWVAKFEAGFAGTPGDESTAQDSTVKYTSNKYFDLTTIVDNIYGQITPNETLMKYPIFIPGVFSYGNVSVGDAYGLAKSLNENENPYGFSKNCNTHMMKNSEWGAIAYLTQSKYGRNGTEIAINNWGPSKTDENIAAGIYYTTEINASNYIFHTGYSSGNIGATDTSARNTGNESTTNYYNTSNGVLSSSTGNVYGIYDLSGGVTEYVSSYAEGLDAPAYSSYKSSQEYYDEYGSYLLEDTNKKLKNIMSIDNNYATANSAVGQKANYATYNNIFGDAIWETSNCQESGGTYYLKSWNGDYSAYPSGVHAFLARGGTATNGAAAGSFYFCTVNGNLVNNLGFRVCVSRPD